MWRSTVLIVMAWCISSVALSQVVIVYPTANKTGVERSPAITIRAPAPIMQASVTRAYPDADVMGVMPDRPTVMVTDVLHDNKMLQERIKVSARGTYAFSDPRTLVFTPAHLIPGHTYRVSVEGLWVEGQHPILLPGVASTFTVAQATPTVMSCSLTPASPIHCRDSIAVEFSQPLERGLGDAGKIIVLEKSNALTEGWIPVQTTLGVAGNTVTVTATDGFAPADLVRLTVNLSELTGNAIDNRVYSTSVRAVTNVEIQAVSSDGRTVPEAIARYFEGLSKTAPIGTTLTLTAQEYFDDRWRLIGWRSNNAEIPGGLQGSVDLDCSNTGRSVVVQAIVQRADTIRIAISTHNRGLVQVYDVDNTLVQTITNTDTLLITDEFTECTLVARPDSGMTFVQWNADSSLFGNLKTPFIVINKSIIELITLDEKEADVQIETDVSTEPHNAVTYSLKGELYDNDNIDGWDAEDGVTFTTESEFNSSGTGSENICVKASACWEILGYKTSETGKSVTYDVPVQEACVRDELRNPTNVIVFFVRRKVIQLRIEKALLASDSHTNFMAPEKLSAEARAVVQIKLKHGTKTVWEPMTEQACYDGNVRFSRYRLQCGDDVRITMRSDLTKAQKFSFFDLLPNYVLPYTDNPNETDPTYSLIVDLEEADFDATDCNNNPLTPPEIRIRACYRQGFGIEAIGLKVRTTNGSDRSKAHFEQRWYSPGQLNDVFDDEPTGGHHLEYVPREGAIVKIRFTLPVDQRTVLAGAIKIDSYDNTLYSDPQNTNLDFSTVSSDGNCSFESEQYESARTVVLSIKDPNTSPIMQALHGGTIKLELTADLTSLNGQPLEHKSNILCQTVELPGYSLSLHEVEYEYDGDADFIFDNDGEIYHAVFGGDVSEKMVYGMDQGFSRIPDCSEQQGVPPGECTLAHSDKDGAQGYGDMLLWIQPNWMDWNDRAWWHAATYDEDCKDNDDCFVNKVADMIGLAKEKTKKLVGNETNTELFGELAEFGVDFVKALLPVDDQDRNLGYGTFVTDGAARWGARRTTRFYEIGDENTTYRLIPRLLVSRAVVR